MWAETVRLKSCQLRVKMSKESDVFVAPTEKKIRFRPPAKVHYSSDVKIEEFNKILETNLLKNDDVPVSQHKDSKQKEKNPSLLAFLQVELTRGYLLEHDEERFSARREKVYSFMKIPQELEKFMAYGFFQCADSFLFVYTFLPLRFAMAFWSLISRPFRRCFGYSRGLLKPAEVCDLLKGFILIICSILMCYIDTNMMYHLVKSQSVMKLYIFYNMLEVGDRLFSAFGQDTIDALFWTATEPRDRRREHLGLIPHLLFALVYVFFHSLLVLFQATTLNVAFNSNNKSLLIIVMSNNFVELKGAVFKKFDKNNLFQVSCSDVRERLHLFVLLFIVVLQTMKEYAWKEERFWVLVPDCILVLGFEVIIDWIKHAFITRFNEIPFSVYREYTLSLAYDMAQTRQKYAFSDHSDLVARRMGFIPLPLGVVITRVILQAMKFEGIAPFILVVVAYLCLMSLRILVSIVILGKACDLIAQHQIDRQANVSTPNVTPKKENISSRDTATSPSKSGDWPPDRLIDNTNSKQNNQDRSHSNDVPLQEPITGPAAIFSNSAIDLNGVCLNEQLLCAKQMKREPVDQYSAEEIIPDMASVSQSVPDIERAWRKMKSNSGVCSPSPMPIEDEPLPQDSTMKRRSESEPNLVNTGEEIQNDC